MPDGREFSFQRWVMLAALVCAALPGRAPAESPALRQARYQIIANQSEQARTTLQTLLHTAKEGEEKDVARVLWTQLPSGRDRGRGQPQPDIGAPKLQTPAVQAEKLRAQFWSQLRRGRRGEALELSQALLKQYPEQLTDLDVRLAVQAAVDARQKGQIKQWLAIGEQRFAGSPIQCWTRTLPLHWSNDAVEGKRRIEEAEAGLPEPLRSVVRLQKIRFIQGDVDDPHRVEKALQVYRQVLARRSVQCRGRAGTFAVPAEDGRSAACLGRLAGRSLERTVGPGHGRSATVGGDQGVSDGQPRGPGPARIAQWRQSGSDCRVAEDYLRQRCWKVAGTLPAELVEQGSDWHVMATMPAVHTNEGQILISTRAAVDAARHFELEVAGAQLEGLVAFGRRSSGVPLVRELARNCKPAAHHTLRYPEDVHPARAPVPYPTPAENEVPLVERFGSAWPAQLVEITVPHPGASTPAGFAYSTPREKACPASCSPRTAPARPSAFGMAFSPMRATCSTWYSTVQATPKPRRSAR